MLKLAASLPTARKDVERDVRSRLYLDPDPWHASRETIPTLSTLRQAVWENRWLRATLLRVRQVPVEHEIAPHALVAKARTWYVVWRRRDGRLRVDRASNVLEARLLDETFVRPPDFDLEAFWAAWAADYEAGRSFFPVTLRVTSRALPELNHDLGRHIRSGGEVGAESGWIELEMTFDYFEHARSALLAYGGAVEVLEPDALRLSIADYAQQIVHQYARSAETDVTCRDGFSCLAGRESDGSRPFVRRLAGGVSSR